MELKQLSVLGAALIGLLFLFNLFGAVPWSTKSDLLQMRNEFLVVTNRIDKVLDGLAQEQTDRYARIPMLYSRITALEEQAKFNRASLDRIEGKVNNLLDRGHDK